MPLRVFKASDFRCLQSLSVELDPHFNVISGPNAAGKTSILEAMGYLGRGKSFRGASPDRLVRHGTAEFVLFGETSADDGRGRKIGVRNGRGGLEISVDGESSGGAAALAEALPLQVIDPDVHDLVAGGPESRRRFLDWLGFHVEPGYLAVWRRFRRALRQRNAALKMPGGAGDLDSWDAELVAAAAPLQALRDGVVEAVAPSIEDRAGSLLGAAVGVVLRRGWRDDTELAQALGTARDRDLQQGSTGVGPHRADLALQIDERQARKLVSRGQQKLLACSLILASVDHVQSVLGRPMLLLLDDPAAELDAGKLAALTAAVEGLGCQVVATALDPERRLFHSQSKRFHVEHGVLHDAA